MSVAAAVAVDAGAFVPAAGWHGKLPTVGDFANRRLDSEFIEAWDAWLSEGIAGLRAANEELWLNAYLSSPSWRFLLLPGVLPTSLPEQTWVGVLMPSVDRVGRYYPLTLAAPLPALPMGSDEVDALWSWLLKLSEAAADALHDDWSIDMLEAELLRIGLPPVTPRPLLPALVPDVLGAVQELDVTAHRHAGIWLAAQAAVAWQNSLQGTCFWYSEVDLATPRLLMSSGLDRNELLGRLFAGIG